MASIFDFFKKKTNGNDLKAVVAPDEKKKNFLDGWLPEDEDKRNALARSLMGAGAGMMVAGGPSASPTNFMQALGKGVGMGMQTYDQALLDDATMKKTRAAADAERLKMEQAEAAEKLRQGLFVGGARGEMGYSPEQLEQYLQYQLSIGDDAGARDTISMIQQLQQTGAKSGMVVGQDGFATAPGYNESIGTTEQYKAAGRVSGEESQRQTDDIREWNLYAEQERAAGREPILFDPWLQNSKKAGATTVTVGGTEPGKGEIFKAMDEERKAATAARSSLNSIYEAKNAIGDGAVTGIAADYVLGLRKAANVFGIGDTDTITNTETFRAAVAPMVATMIKDTVGSANISNSDREFAEKAAGGNITLDATSIARLLDIQERYQKDKITRYNSRVDTLYPDIPENEKTRAFFGGIDIPENTYTGGDKTSSTTAGAVVVSSEEQFNALPAGASYRFDDDPPTTRRVKR